MIPKPDPTHHRFTNYSSNNRGVSSHAGHAGKDIPYRRSGTDEELVDALDQLDGRNYSSYKSLIGDWNYLDFELGIDRVQADPFAPPSALHAVTTPKKMGLPLDLIATPDQRVAVADFLVRAFRRSIERYAPGGAVRIARTGPEILERSACTVTQDRVELRFQVQLPARNRSILGHTAATIFDKDVPDAIVDTFEVVSPDAEESYLEALRAHVHAYEDHKALQAALEENGWVAFVADGAVLARISGVSQKPLEGAVPFESPDSLRREVTLPHRGVVRGLAVEPGVTVIVGGGYHGKSTLLGAIQRGVYAHVPGDGRELVAALPEAVKVRAADGRAVTGVDVSPFITHLPDGSDATAFSSENASGSTSQAAAIVEAVELQTPLLLIDEDTSATNLLIRDARMRMLVEADKEPITPLVDRIASLAHGKGVSTIIVMGGSGDLLDVADRVLMLDTYRCFDVTERARRVVAEQPREILELPWPLDQAPRRPLRDAGQVEGHKTKASGLDKLFLGDQTVDLSDVEQIVEPGQTETIAWALRGLLDYVGDGRSNLPQLLDQLEEILDRDGLDALTRYGLRQYPAFLVRPRRIDIGAALNRYRGLYLA